MDGEGEESEKKETEDPKEANMNEDEKIDAEYGLNDYDNGNYSNQLQNYIDSKLTLLSLSR